MRRYVRLMGPTAAGKTAVAVALRARLPVEIVSVDSAMVYREMDVGTGKPDAALLLEAPHRLIDVREPSQTYSAAEFAQDAAREIDAIGEGARIPLLVGGTGLYFRALHEGLSPLPVAAPEVRARIAAEGARLGWERMHARLARIDPVSAARVHPHDRQRIQRGLEIWEVARRPWSELLSVRARPAPAVGDGGGDDVLSLVIAPRRREDLHRAIEERFRRMLDAGLVEEVARLRARGDLHPELPSMRAVGYRQVWELLAGLSSYEEMISRSLAATRGLARRQLTWLRGEEPTAEWVELGGGLREVRAAVDVLSERIARWLDGRGPGTSCAAPR